MPDLLDRCRACRARLAGNAVCSRCGCDFSLVRQAMEQAGSLLDRAVCALAAGDRATARAQVEASLATNRTRLGQALAIFLDDAAPRIAGRREEHAFFSSALVGAKADPLDAWPGG